MSNKILVILTCFLLILPLIGSCSKGTASVRYQKIDAREAKSIIDNEDDIVILDVRTKQEYDQGHILNAVLIPDVNLKDEVEEIIPDKNIKILVYCRSGRRSAASAKLLIEMGYKNVYDFGGINDWPYDIVTD
ncbi:MAG: rhodanese-like domain-containing protein [Caldicoprobacterales bacterium]|nr:rhodanese-like domain-containing protein [Clostridiales bacterium]